MKKLCCLFCLISTIGFAQYRYYLIKFHPQMLYEINDRYDHPGLGLTFETEIAVPFTMEISYAIGDISIVEDAILSAKLNYYFSQKCFEGIYTGLQLGTITDYAPFLGLETGFQYFLNGRWMAKGHIGMGNFLGWGDGLMYPYLSGGMAISYLIRTRI